MKGGNVGTLADQLRSAGLVTEKVYQETTAAKELEALGNKISRIASNYDDLNKAKNMREFKNTAKEILTRDASQIGAIIQKAHDKFKGQPGDKKFFWFFYQIRDGLKNLPKEKQPELLRKAFRKSGSTFEISEE